MVYAHSNTDLSDIEDYILKNHRKGKDGARMDGEKGLMGKKNGEGNYNYIDYSNIVDIKKCKTIFVNLLEWLAANKDLLFMEKNAELGKAFERELQKQIRLSKIQGMRKSILLNVFNNVLKKELCSGEYSEHIDMMKLLLRKRACRNLSGISSITVITAPFPDGQKFSCSHNCYYCPNEPAHAENNWQAQPRSYLFNEPAVLRANQNSFFAFHQMISRMDTLFNNGLVVDKLEIIVEGGTYTEYPVEYLERYHRDLFYAANVYFDYLKAVADLGADADGGLRPDAVREPLTIAEEIRINKTADVHIIGVCIETRPDALDDEWLRRFRLWGVTRVQIGIQHVDNRVLKKINRGHTIEQALWAMQYLKDNCFKIDIHIMPDLPGSTPDMDREMFDYVYSVICPDQMKVYPCEVVPWTIIEKWYKKGLYTPYYDKNPRDLVDVVRYSMTTCPNWVRLPRVIRDIPSSYIECGNTLANLRQIIDKELDAEGVVSMDIRSREIGRHSKYYGLAGGYNTYRNWANNGDDYFIAYESFDLRALFGFIRLRIVKGTGMIAFDVLRGRGLVRELHVYGDTQKVGALGGINGCQHKGIGSGLLRLAEKKTMEHGLYGIAVISGEGVKGYYEKKGYKDVDTFMVKDFWWFEVWFWMGKRPIRAGYNYLINYIIMGMCFLRKLFAI